ncbi:MAG: hypothetical protein Ct9H90mP16_19940 [Candidatus Poseidoniales archaeon]|nr:MAG: hypothetical protein Ct9H90mP16_19940 [Candidatus Poseidoniales archaeon]
MIYIRPVYDQSRIPLWEQSVSAHSDSGFHLDFIIIIVILNVILFGIAVLVRNKMYSSLDVKDHRGHFGGRERRLSSKHLFIKVHGKRNPCQGNFLIIGGNSDIAKVLIENLLNQDANITLLVRQESLPTSTSENIEICCRRVQLKKAICNKPYRRPRIKGRLMELYIASARL